MTGPIAAAVQTELVNVWETQGPEAAHERVKLLTREEIEYLLMVNIGSGVRQ